MHFDVLSRSLECARSHFLEASAGTGKTFAIEHLVVRLLIEGQKPLLIEQILVVTFTRAATRELKARIYRNLKAIREELQSKTSSIDYVQAILERGEEKKALERLEAALICYDRAPIYTLHGLCYRLLKEFAFEARCTLHMADPDEGKSSQLVKECVKEFLRKELKAPHYSSTQLHLLLKSYRKRPLELIAELSAWVESGKKVQPLPTFQELFAQFVTRLQTLRGINPVHFKEDLAQLLPRYVKMTREEIPSQVELLASILGDSHCSVEQFDSLLRFPLFLEQMDDAHLKKKLKSLAPLHYPHLIAELKRTLLPLIQQARDASSIVLRLLSDVQHKVGAVLKNSDMFSFDALLLKVQEALSSESWVKLVRQKFQAAIIDEFQDTDVLQWTIFKTLFPPESSLLYLVGDPKQSIYAFRNADVYVYLEAARALGEGAKKYLATNFRSTPSLVEALNRLFAQESWLALPQLSQGLLVPKLLSGSQEPPLDAQDPIQWWIAPCKQGRSKKFPPTALLEELFFPQLASEILFLKDRVAFHDMAVLVKDRFQAQLVVEYLQSCHIPVAAARSPSLVTSEAFFSLKEVLKAVASPQDRSQLKAALGTPLIGMSAQALSAAPQEEALLLAAAHMRELKSIELHEGFGACFQALLQTRWDKMEPPLLEQLCARGQHELLLDLRQLCALILEAKAEPLECLERWQADPDHPTLQKTSQEEKGSVRVMTMHKSKGLEFEVVFALGVCARQPSSEFVTIKTDAGSCMVPLDVNDAAAQRALAEEREEKLRQLYVCLTRAKKKIYIFLPLDETAPEESVASPLELFLLKKGVSTWDADSIQTKLGIEAAVLKAQTPPVYVADIQTPELQPPAPLVSIPIRPAPSSFTSLSTAQHPLEAKKIDPQAPLSAHTLPLGKETGIFLHSLFETILKKGLHHPLDAARIEKLIHSEVHSTPLAPWKNVLTPWILEVLTLPLAHFALVDIPPCQLQQEMEFLYPTSQGMMKGFADLVFMFKERYYLLDWKSNYLGPSDADYTQEALCKEVERHEYALQASIYKEALRRYVKLFDNRPFESCFGGALYYFIRGKAVYTL